LRGEQRLVECAAEPLGGLVFLGDAGQQPIQFGVGVRQLGERTQRICGAGALSIGHGLDRDVAGRAELIGVRRIALRQQRSAWLMPFWMSAIDAGRVATAWLMSVPALSMASSSVRACPAPIRPRESSRPDRPGVRQDGRRGSGRW